METFGTKTIPQLPLLNNELDVENWKLQVSKVLQFYGLEGYIAPASSEKRVLRTAEYKAFVLGLITTSVLPVASRLQKAGWDFAAQGQDPEDLYLLTLNVILPPSEVAQTVAHAYNQFYELDPNKFADLTEYLDRISQAKRRLEILDCPLNEKMAVCFLMHALSTQFPDWCDIWAKQMVAGNLKWDKLMEELLALDIWMSE